MGILKKIFAKKKTSAELKADVFKKATDHWNANSELTGFSDSETVTKQPVNKNIDPLLKQNIRLALQALALAGETGILPKSLSDQTNLSNNDIHTAMKYLISKEYAEEINSTNGKKYYLTGIGEKYCINKKYI